MNKPLPRIPQASLADPQIRMRLLDKVEGLMAVLGAAQVRVDDPAVKNEAGEERLKRVRTNLEKMLKVCNDARAWLRQPVTSDAMALRRPMTFREYVEVSSFAEYLVLSRLGPLTEAEVDKADVEELCRIFGEFTRDEDAA
jgi:hypothetical protein